MPYQLVPYLPWCGNYIWFYTHFRDTTPSQIYGPIWAVMTCLICDMWPFLLSFVIHRVWNTHSTPDMILFIHFLLIMMSLLAVKHHMDVTIVMTMGTMIIYIYMIVSYAGWTHITVNWWMKNCNNGYNDITWYTLCIIYSYLL